MVISRGDIWCADLGQTIGSAPGYRRPVVIVQCDALNLSRIGTVVCVPVTSNLKWAQAPGNVVLPSAATSLDRDPVATVSQVIAVDKQQFIERAGKISSQQLSLILSGIDIVLGR